MEESRKPGNASKESGTSNTKIAAQALVAEFHGSPSLEQPRTPCKRLYEEEDNRNGQTFVATGEDEAALDRPWKHYHGQEDHEGLSPSHSHSHEHSGQKAFAEHELLQEKQHFETVLAAFRYYKIHGLKKLASQRNRYDALRAEDKLLLPTFMEHVNDLRQCLSINQTFVEKLLEHTPFDESFRSGNDSSDPGKNGRTVGTFHMDKVHTTIRMFVRDWSREGQLERSQAYGPLIQAVQKYFPKDMHDARQVQILNPGSGLGRLSWELARCGYTSIGNEFSLYMLLGSNFILNCCRETDAFRIYPWIGHASNSLSSANQMIGVSVPDVNPAADLPEGHSFGMVAGDFLEVFEANATWDCVVSCFFIDTARNILEYIDHIWKLLKPGGYWMNLGPLLYHFADLPQQSCLELTYEQVKMAVIKRGFVFLEEKLDVACGYVQNPFSMLRHEYRCVYFVCQKPVTASAVGAGYSCQSQAAEK